MNKLMIIAFLGAASLPLLAQNPAIPTLQVCNVTNAAAVLSSGTPQLFIPSRAGGGFTGTVNFRVSAGCDTNGFPTGSVTLFGLSMSDSPAEGFIQSGQIDQITFTGWDNPTAFVSGQCRAQVPSFFGTANMVPCHFWILFAHDSGPNDSTVGGGPDIVSFLVVDQTGKRLAYGTGPVGGGNILVFPTKN